MKAKKIVPKAIINKVIAINEMLPSVLMADEIPVSYAGGTFPYYIDIRVPIVVSNQFVYIKEEKGSYSYGFEKRYNVNNECQLDELKYDLSIIKRAFNKVIKIN
jgi:hypothetical protein